MGFPSRLSHWVIAALVAVCWWTAASDWMYRHRIAGYGVLGFTWFRPAWGFFGGQTARFRHFIRGPASTLRYVRKLLGREDHGSPALSGHNPLGALRVIVIVARLTSQTTFDMFAVDVDSLASGPLSRSVSFDTARRLPHWHAANFHLLPVITGVHPRAIAYYCFARNENLMSPMLHGFNSLVPSGEAPCFVSRWRAVPLAAEIIFGIALILSIR